MTITELQKRLCKDLVVGSYIRNERSFIATRFSYPGGDLVTLYLQGSEPEQFVTDLGTTHFALRVAGVDMETEARRDFLASVCVAYGIEVTEDFVLRRIITPETANESVLSLCEAITRISTMYYDQRTRHFSGLRNEVESLITLKVPEAYVKRNWFDPTIDPAGDYPVDYHMNTMVDPRNLFVVSTRLMAESAISTMNFFQAKGQNDPAMTIVAPKIALPRRVERKLESNSLVSIGVDGNEDRIVRFATERQSPAIA